MVSTGKGFTATGDFSRNSTGFADQSGSLLNDAEDDSTYKLTITTADLRYDFVSGAPQKRRSHDFQARSHPHQEFSRGFATEAH